MATVKWEMPLEQKCIEPGHWHIEGYCVYKYGIAEKQWRVKREGCMGDKTDNPEELGLWYRTLAKVRLSIRREIWSPDLDVEYPVEKSLRQKNQEARLRAEYPELFA